MFSLEELIEKISEHTELSKEKIKEMIKEKQIELSGLVSLEGAAYIVGRELGVSLLKESKRDLKIKNIVPGMRSVDFLGRIVKIYDTREFERNGEKGSVTNIVLGDETSLIRLSLWGEENKLLEELNLKENDVVRVSRAFVKEDNRGNPEVRLGKVGKIEKVEEVVTLPESIDLKKSFDTAKEKIKDLKEGDYGKVRACIIQLFKKNPFFKVCPKCESKVEETPEGFKCLEHGLVEPKDQIVISGIIDDGTGNIRVTFFRDLAEKIFEKNIDELKKIAEKEVDVTAIYDVFPNFGKDFIIKGRVKTNQFTGKLELLVNEIEEVDFKKESKKLLNNLKVEDKNKGD